MLEFSRAVCVEDVYSVLLKHCASFGVTSVFAGVIPRTIIRPAEQPSYVVLGHWPEEWAGRYFEKQYMRRDRTILHCATREEPIWWADIKFGAGETIARRIMDEAREFRLNDGITIPQLTIDGARIGVSFSGDRLDKSPTAVVALTMLASYAVTRALQIRASTCAIPVHLTRRERECLSWSAEGKIAADVADILGVTGKAIEKHLASARSKLDSLTTTQAVAQALRLGLIG